MKKLIKIFVLCSFIFALSFAGIKISAKSPEQAKIQFNINTPISSTALPTSFDLRDRIDIGVENQNPYGICYAYASLTSLETYLALNYGEYYDFSELHFALSLCLQSGYYDTVDQALYDGGNFTHFITYTQKDNAIVLENEMPMSKYLTLAGSNRINTMTTDYNNINNNFYPLVKVNDTRTFDKYIGDKSNLDLTSFRNEVKSHIMQYGSLTAGIYTNSSTFTFNTINYKVTDDSLIVDDETIAKNFNHLISIVGWDDTYNANGAWSNPGAYICLNSWGENFGDNGYFYVSYDDYFIEYSIQGVVNATLSTTNNQINSINTFQDNTFMVSHTITGGSNLWVANIIDVSANVGESISYIDEFVMGGETKFYIDFFQNKNTALSGINSVTVMNYKQSSKLGSYSIYNKHQLNSPLEITNNYMVIVTYVKNATRVYSLCTKIDAQAENRILDTTYYSSRGLSTFDINDSSYVWDPGIDGYNTETSVPIILHTNTKYIEVNQFSSDAESLINSKYVKNNAIFYNKSINLQLTNATNFSEHTLQSITITKLYNKSFVDVTSNFTITQSASSPTILTIKMSEKLNSTFTKGNYLISIPINDCLTIYRVIEVQNLVAYSIKYELNGGTATNPSIYTNNHTTLNLTNPVKAGYTFVGWYTDGDLTIPFDCNSLPFTALTLYAKYDFATPTISNKSKDVVVTYYKNIKVDINVTASHALLNDYNTLSYQWYWRKTLSDDYTIVDGATTNALSVYTVAEAGYYACEVIITITDPALTDTPCTKILQPRADTEILVNIKPYIYDTSNAKWTYTDAISYDTLTHTVEVINLPNDVQVVYTDNEFVDIGTYTAHAEFVYDNMDGNAIANPIADLTWEIRKAKITIAIDDIVSTNEINIDTLNQMFSCSIDNEYLPDGIDTLQDKLDYLQLNYELHDTSQPYIKTITVTTTDFDIHEIVVVTGQYRVIVNSLSNNGVTATNNNGFVKDCVFTATPTQLDNDIIKQLTNKHLNIVNTYTLSYSYLNPNDQINVFIPISRRQLLNNISVYAIKDGKAIIVKDAIISANGISFNSNEQNVSYIIVENDNAHTSNTHFIVMICIIGAFVALYGYIIIVHIKHKKHFK